MIRRPPRSTQSRSSAASDVYKRQLYHLSAVVGCNLLVALESEAKRLMDEATGGEDGLDHLAPLLTTAMKNLLGSGDPAHALTGPVARGDVGTVRAHLRLLDRESPRATGPV